MYSQFFEPPGGKGIGSKNRKVWKIEVKFPLTFVTLRLIRKFEKLRVRKSGIPLYLNGSASGKMNRIPCCDWHCPLYPVTIIQTKVLRNRMYRQNSYIAIFNLFPERLKWDILLSAQHGNATTLQLISFLFHLVWWRFFLEFRPEHPSLLRNRYLGRQAKPEPHSSPFVLTATSLTPISKKVTVAVCLNAVRSLHLWT